MSWARDRFFKEIQRGFCTLFDLQFDSVRKNLVLAHRLHRVRKLKYLLVVLILIFFEVESLIRIFFYLEMPFNVNKKAFIYCKKKKL